MPSPDAIARALESRPSPLFLAYQPIKQIGQTHLAANTFEALLRMKTDRGVLSAGEFLPLIDDAHLKHQIDLWVMRELSRQMRRDEFRYAVNLSDSSCHYEQIHHQIRDIFDGVHMSDRLIVEISESVILNGMAKLVLPMIGESASIWMDDFGSSNANFITLQLMQKYLRGIKIDGRLVQCLTKDQFTPRIIEAIFGFCWHMDLDCTCEWVEDQQTLDRLARMADQYPGLRVWVQGWVLG